jgi:hypothetical protein
MTRSDWLDMFVKSGKCLFINTRPSWCKLIMVIPTIKFILHESIICKRAHSGGYLLGGKRQAYFVGKTSNLPLSYLPIKTFNIVLLLVISVFWPWTEDLIKRTGSTMAMLSPSWSRRCYGLHRKMNGRREIPHRSCR